MSEQSVTSLYRKQKKVRPKIEDIIHELLDDDRKKNALNFVAYVRANKMAPQWATANSWSVSYKNRRVCYINLSDGSWRIRCSGDYSIPFDSIVSNENLRETAFANVSFCVSCNPCSPGRHTTILGKGFDNVCNCFHFIFHNPGAKTLECVKRIMEIRKNVISGNV